MKYATLFSIWFDQEGIVMSSPGRNDPCPCGSGQKYKKCCYLREAGPAANEPGFLPGLESMGVSGELEAALRGREFSSLEEVQAFADAFMNRRNRASAAGFHGLSPDQMFNMLRRPFESLHLVTFAEHPVGCEDAPIMRLFLLLAEAAGDKGFKATAKGNLPQKFCREAARRYWGEEEYARRTHFSGINREDDFPDLHTLRVTSVLAGLVRKYRGRYVLTKRCRQTLDAGDIGRLYQELLQAYTREFNWAYLDGYPDFGIIQHAFLFTLYLLHRYGSEPRHHGFYVDAFVEAFPAILDEVEIGILPPEVQVQNCYTLRTLLRFARFLGLADVRSIDGDKILAREGYRVEALPLLDEVVRFHGLA